ncbi:MAG: phosphatidate cytidylyltransferase [Clostridia bacterium]|nr:phosphatidate cytidylyltransferase [Clostridia bacterium]
MLVRILVGLGLAALVVLVLWFGDWVQCLLFSLVTFMCVYELSTVLHRSGYKSFAAPVYVYALLYYPATLYGGVYWLLILTVLCVLFILMECVWNKDREIRQSFVSLAMLMYPVMLFLFVALTHTLMISDVNRVALLMLFAAPCLSDTFAYFVGVAVGKRKLCPRLSPKKTVEGSVGGLVGGVLAGVLTYYAQMIWIVYEEARIGLIPLMLLGLLCAAVGQFGDLFASSIKRACSIKDFGTILPGHGGMLDRVDSIIVCAPIVFLFFFAVNEKLAAYLDVLP